MKKELLIKYLNNRCTETELSEVFRWFNADALNEEGKKWIFEDWNSYQETNLEEDEKFISIFDKIQEKIDRSSQKSNVKTSKTITFSVIENWITRVAAVLLIPVLTFLFYTLSEKRNISDQYANLLVDSLEVIAPMGSRTVVQLSDGSVVHLNYGSRIKYPQFFSGDTRKVVLTGEGYFKVAHNPQKPFIVKAGNLNIKAVGTTFNVMAYSDNNIIETTLVEGKVILDQITHNGNTKTIGTMIPGQHVNFDLKTTQIQSTKGKVEKYISWIEGKLIFEDTPILQVTERLSRMFNVDFEIKDELKDYNYTVTLEDESLSQILDLITIATPVLYKTLPRKKLLDGTYSKQKIILEKRKWN
ncbi:MAG TPA: FecR domain-containing protein [Prolixibacteraceae bacterium]|nr:FecR domain-containing protein [Prolixibacteraceae bacterium]